ncbi:MAG: peptidase M14 [Candidatus Hydrogenedentes bacterium]|nr:peptidase M14 [Candidatus Hydrogenedentota bacterium]
MSRLDDLLAVRSRDRDVEFRDTWALGRHLRDIPGIRVFPIGESRDGEPLFGYTAGHGPETVTLTAGCHADEPVGPMTAQALPWLLQEYAPDLLEKYTFRVVPQMNPDGARRNRIWFADPPDFETYVRDAVREAPGDDIEFGFAGDDGARPECRAAMPFLWGAGPVAAHFSLHGMAWAEGAWFLLNPPWAGRAAGLMDALAALCGMRSLPLMEIDRGGEKGFSRVRTGFSTTPNSVAMRAFFLERNDPETAAKFRPSSMEAAMAAGGDPLCMVSELPMFLLDVPASLSDPVLYRFKADLDAARSAGAPDALRRVAESYRLRPLPLGEQIAMQFAMIVLALDARSAINSAGG